MFVTAKLIKESNFKRIAAMNYRLAGRYKRD